eukprot:Nk52_evm26s216 gene=Nk52_evmTU26s216
MLQHLSCGASKVLLLVILITTGVTADVDPWAYHEAFPQSSDTEIFANPMKCLNDSFAKELGWAANLPSVERKPIMLEVSNWNTVRIVGIIQGLLMRDVMLYTNVSVRERTATVPSGAEEDNGGSRCGKGYSHVQLERWSSEENYYTRWSEQTKLCERLGEIGYKGMNGYYTNQAALTASNDILEYYRAIVKNKDLLKVFEPAPAEPLGNCTMSFCKTFTASGVPAYPGQGRYQTNACVSNLANGGHCALMYMNTPAFVTTILESMAENYEFPINFEYLGADGVQEATVEEKHNKGTPVMFYYWEPSVLISKYTDMQRMSFPQHTADCYETANIDRVNIRKVPCDFSQQSLINFAWGGLRDYDPSVYKFAKEFKMSLKQISEILADIGLTKSSIEQAACNWIRNNPNVWRNWVPTVPAVIQFRTSTLEILVDITGQVNIPVDRVGGSIGSVNVSVADITSTASGQLHLRSLGVQEAIPNVDFIPVEDDFSSNLFWENGETGSKVFKFGVKSSARNGHAVVLELNQLVTNSGKLGLNVIIVIFNESPCEDRISEVREGGFLIWDNTDIAFDSSNISGTIFTLIVFVITTAEIFFFIVLLISRIVSYVKGTSSRKVSVQKSPEESTANPPRRNTLMAKLSTLKATHLSKSMLSLSNSMSGMSRLVGFKPSEQKTEIHPTIENMYPIIACFTDFLQIMAIAFAPDLPWLNNSIIDYLSFSHLPLSWYFFLILALVFPWELFMIFILTGMDARLERHLIGRIILVPSDYLIPIGASILFIPTLSVMFSVFECTATKTPLPTQFTLPPELFASEILVLPWCSLTCWDSRHWAYAVIAAVITSIYIPLALIAAPLWQSINRQVAGSVGKLDVEYRPKFFVIDSILKYLLVFVRIFFRQYIYAFYTILIFSLLVYIALFFFLRPCKIQWIGNIRLFLYVMLFYFSVVSIISISTTDDDSVWPFIVMATVFVAALVVYALYDWKAYPRKVVASSDETRQRIRSFLQEYNDVETIYCGSEVDTDLRNEDEGSRDDESKGIRISLDSKITDIYANPEALAWFHIEKDVKEQKKSGKFIGQEVEYITFLLVKKSPVLKFIWEISKNEKLPLEDSCTSPGVALKTTIGDATAEDSRPGYCSPEEAFCRYLRWVIQDSLDYEQFHMAQATSKGSFASSSGLRLRRPRGSINVFGGSSKKITHLLDGPTESSIGNNPSSLSITKIPSVHEDAGELAEVDDVLIINTLEPTGAAPPSIKSTKVESDLVEEQVSLPGTCNGDGE